MDVNPKLLKKTGEILAFAQLSIDTFTKAHNALIEVFTEKEIQDIITANKSHIDSIHTLFTNEQVETIHEKAKKTKTKLEEMQKIYLEEKWSEAVEVLEWLGFAEGAALVHWSLVEELAGDSKNKSVEDFALLGYRFHKDLLVKISEEIKKL